MAAMSKKNLAGVISEQDGEESEASHVNIETNEAKARRELAEKGAVINKYKRID